MNALLTRDEFRRQVLQRDRHQCLLCGKKEGLSVHHVIERKLFPDGGYYLNNAATLCEGHHLRAEMTALSAEEIRAAAGIREVLLPPQFNPTKRYDKWGNIILEDGRRLEGPLFSDAGCRKVLRAAGLLHLFAEAPPKE